MRISEVARRAGVLPTTIRFYESTGLLPPAHRLNGQRVYGQDVLDHLALIRFGLNTGFSLRELKLLLLDFGSRAKRRNAVQSKVTQLKNLRDHIRVMERLLKQIKLCRCETIRQVGERLAGSGISGNSLKASASHEQSRGLVRAVKPQLHQFYIPRTRKVR